MPTHKANSKFMLQKFTNTFSEIELMTSVQIFDYIVFVFSFASPIKKKAWTQLFHSLQLGVDSRVDLCLNECRHWNVPAHVTLSQPARKFNCIHPRFNWLELLDEKTDFD